MKYVYADRTVHLGDMDYYPVPINKPFMQIEFISFTLFALPERK